MADTLQKDLREIFQVKRECACDVYKPKKCKRKDGQKLDQRECRKYCKIKTQKINHFSCDNAFLLMNRFLSDDRIIENEEYTFDAKSFLKTFHQDDNHKLPIHEAIKNGMEAIHLAEEQEKAIRVMEEMQLIKLKSFHCKQDWHMIVGIGGNTVSEVGMTLHFINGVPFIPGQGIKGCLRHFVIQDVFNGNEERAYKDVNFIAVFGSEQSEDTMHQEIQAGNIIFYDAYPLNNPSFSKDIMTNHNVEYYQGKKDLADNEQPNIVQFYCIKNTEFKFYIGVRTRLYEVTESRLTPKQLLETAAKWFDSMLECNGFGAKTAVGYGYVRKIEEETEEGKESEQQYTSDEKGAEPLASEESINALLNKVGKSNCYCYKNKNRKKC